MTSWCTASAEAKADRVAEAVGERVEQVGLRLHPDKTRIVYCPDRKRRGVYEHTSLTFLGFTFRQRTARNKPGQHFSVFLAAISKHALNKVSTVVRWWRLHHQIGRSLADLARWINPIVGGWMRYYGVFYRFALDPLRSRINAYLVGWIGNTDQRLRPVKKAITRWQAITTEYPRMLAHWAWTPSVPRVW